MVSCSDGEDGAQGPQGIQGKKGDTGDTGQQGEVGENGENGADGANGDGYDELTQYGHITMNVSGTRPDGVAFEDTATFKFTTTEYPFSTISENDNATYFDTVRFLSTPDDVYQASYITLNLGIQNFEEEGMEILGFETFGLENYPVVGEDHKYFILNANNNNLNAFGEIENLTFDAADRNHATYSYSIVLPAENNSSGHELQVSGEVDVYLLEQL